MLPALVAGCSRTPAEPAPGASSAAPAATFLREAFAPQASDAGATEPPVPTTADPAALEEILANVPARAPGRGSTGLDGGTAIGADTGLREDAGADPAPAPEAPRKGRIQVGKPTVETDVSSAAIEQAARGQLYWGLTQRCRGPDGRILPPEAVRVIFQIDGDGYLVPPTILATPKEERFAAAARCIARELSTTTFRAPPAARGGPHNTHNVTMDVPSVD